MLSVNGELQDPLSSQDEAQSKHGWQSGAEAWVVSYGKKGFTQKHRDLVCLRPTI